MKTRNFIVALAAVAMVGTAAAQGKSSQDSQNKGVKGERVCSNPDCTGNCTPKRDGTGSKNGENQRQGQGKGQDQKKSRESSQEKSQDSNQGKSQDGSRGKSK